MILTGIVDIDLEILIYTDDLVLEELLLTHKYIYNLNYNYNMKF